MATDSAPHKNKRKRQPTATGFHLQYDHPHGQLYQGDSVAWLASLESNSVDLVFADPPYNVKKADWDTFESQEAYMAWSLSWIPHASRILKPSGSLYVSGFSEILADLKRPAMAHFNRCRWLVWHYKNKANLGKDWGRSHESILHFRKSDTTQLNMEDTRTPYNAHTLKYPVHPQAKTSTYGKGTGQKHDLWTPHPKGAKPKDVIEIPTTCNGMGEKTPHPTQKPEALLRKLVLASSQEGDWVVDPFSGSGTTLVVAEQLGRRWMGCDREAHYNQWAIQRINTVRRLSKDAWIEHDRKAAEKRDACRRAPTNQAGASPKP